MCLHTRPSLGLHSPPNTWSMSMASAVVALLWCWMGVAHATPQDSETTPSVSPLQIERLELDMQSIAEENARLSEEIQMLKEQAYAPTLAQPLEFGGMASTDNVQVDTIQLDTMQLGTKEYIATYDKGIMIRPKNLKESPYTFKINHQNTFRYTGFARSESSWVDSSSVTNPIFDRSDFAIPRGRLIFSGTAFMPEISYLLNIDYNTVNNNPIGFRAYSLSYKASRAFQVFVGQNKVPGTREWLHSSFDAQHGPDRSMATTFFRPSLSQGVWFTGQLADAFNYHAMVSNGFNTLNVNPRQLNNRFCSSQSCWWEPLGDFGKGYSDIEAHDAPAVRLGGSYTFTLEKGSQASEYPENTLVRLSDGTLITQEGALAPGVTVQAFHLSLAAIDVAFKYRGLSFSTEIYQQILSAMRGNGPLPVASLETYGGVAQAGYFIVPQKLEVYSRNSFVTGDYGSGTEFGTGFNWFVLKGKSNLRYTFDTAWLDSSPADQNRTGFVAGQSGLLIRTQISSSF